MIPSFLQKAEVRQPRGEKIDMDDERHVSYGHQLMVKMRI